jgi:hypothetical protein
MDLALVDQGPGVAALKAALCLVPRHRLNPVKNEILA